MAIGRYVFPRRGLRLSLVVLALVFGVLLCSKPLRARVFALLDRFASKVALGSVTAQLSEEIRCGHASVIQKVENDHAALIQEVHELKETLSTFNVAPHWHAEPSPESLQRRLPGVPASVRLLPYPFQTYVAICSDPDAMQLPDCLKINRLVHDDYELNLGDQVFVDVPHSDATNHSILELQMRGTTAAPKDLAQFHQFLVDYNRGWFDGIHGWASAPMVSETLDFDLTTGTKPVQKDVAVPILGKTPTDQSYVTDRYLIFEYRLPECVPYRCRVLDRDKELEVHQTLDGSVGLRNALVWTPAFVLLPSQETKTVVFELQGAPGATLQVRNLAATNFCRTSAAAEEAALEKYNVRFLCYTEHGKMNDESVLGGRYEFDKGQTRPQFLGDNPAQFNSFFIDLLDRQGVTFISAQHYTGDARLATGIEVAAEPHQFNDRVVRYNLHRFAAFPRRPDGTTRPFRGNTSWEPWLGFLIDRLLARSQVLGDGGVIYTHWGCQNPHDTSLSPQTKRQLETLRNRYYNLGGSFPLHQRVWVAPTAEIALLSRALRGIKDNASYDEENNVVHVRSWQDYASRQVVPTPGTRCFGLANVTFYVHDSAAARLMINGREYTCLKRNPKDLTGSESITIVDDSVPTTVFDEVDPLQRFGEATTDDAEFYVRSVGAFAGQQCLHLQLTDARGATTLKLPDLTSANTTHLRFAYRKSRPGIQVGLRLRYHDGGELTATEDPECDSPGWRLTPRADVAWHDVVVDFADVTDKDGKLSHRRGVVEEVVLTAKGEPGDVVSFDGVQFLRNPVHPPNPEGWVLIGGRTEPAEDGVEVRLEDGEKRYVTRTEKGVFLFPGVVRKGAIVKVYAVPADGVAHYVTRGRFVEANRNEVELTIPLRDLRDVNKGRNLKRINRAVSEIHPEAGSIYKPKSRYQSSGIGTPVEFQPELQVSNLGLLDRDQSFSNPDHARRVVLLGNCNLFGHSTPIHSHTSVVLEGLLQGHYGYRFEVMSLANSTVNFGRYWPYYEAIGRRFHPEVICIFVQGGVEVVEAEPNLFCRFNEYDPKHLPGGMFRSRADGTLEYLKGDPQYFRYVGKDQQLHARREKERKVGYYFMDGVDWSNVLHLASSETLPPRAREALQHFHRVARYYRDEFKKDGARMMIALSPDVQAYCYAKTEKWKSVDGLACEREKCPERLEAICRDLGIGFVDTGKYVRDHYPDPVTCGWRYDNHPSPYGQEWMADALYEYLVKTGFLEDLPANDPGDPVP